MRMCVCAQVTDRDPPNLIETMIDMVLNPGHVEARKQLYEGQVCMYVCTNVCTCACMYACTYVYVCMYARMFFVVFFFHMLCHAC